ncbi:MAG: helix-hairpin-helix domain-containing protein [Chloroflexi bacterium]|nr:helix-hairpin-helix domain-containing protein [Chloroflexota bacterium]
MTDLLTFLNSAELDTLTKVSGISRTLAGNIITARPFETEDDCLKVRGVGHALLERARGFAEAQENASENRALIQVKEEASPSVEKFQPKEEPAREPRPSFWSRVSAVLLSIFRGLIRLVALLIILGAIAALAIYGLPILRDYLLAPVEQNSAEIAELRSELNTLQTQVIDLQAQLAETQGRVETVEQSIEAYGASITKLEEMQSTLETTVAAGDEKLAADLKREILLTRAIQYLSRARLYLSQSNFGLARDDIRAARALLAEVQTNEPDFKTEALTQTILRLDLAIANLPAFPVVAVGDVDIALQLLMSDLPDGLTFPTATPSPTLAPTETPTPEETVTPTLEATATP